jgi:hypothetical protein
MRQSAFGQVAPILAVPNARRLSRNRTFDRKRALMLATIWTKANSNFTSDYDLEDRGVMDEAIDGGQRHGGIGEDLAPFAEWQVGGNEDGAAPYVLRR